MNKQELLNELNLAWSSYTNENGFHSGVRTGLGIALGVVEKLDEPEKVVVPKFVANYIELCKGGNGDRQAYTEGNSELWFALNGDNQGMPNSVSDWLFNEEKVETFARAWLDGYEIEKEKLYYVLDKNNHTMLYRSFDYSITQSKSKYAVDPARKNFNLNEYKLTEQEIRNYDARFMAFAVEVAE